MDEGFGSRNMKESILNSSSIYSEHIVLFNTKIYCCRLCNIQEFYSSYTTVICQQIVIYMTADTNSRLVTRLCLSCSSFEEILQKNAEKL